MCGIAGQFGAVSGPTIEQMTDRLVHRGPDASGLFCDGPVGLGHTRLSIIDPETGDQPLFNEDDSVAVVFNGEIYNYRSLRESLSGRAHTFETETDTEVLVHLYEEEGPSFVDRLDGMFAFALWDSNRERLVLARDRFGIKPLFFAEGGETFTFASELPALLAGDVAHGGIDRTALAQYFGFGFIPAPRTAFQGISRVRPGERVVVTADGVDRTSFYEPSVSARAPGLNAAADSLRGTVTAAVGRRLQSDVPLGAFLSGGIDSSIVVGVLADLLDQPVQTFTVGFEADRFDEAWAARTVADYHDTDHTEYTVTADHVRETIPEVLGRLGEPFADPSLIPTYVVARESSRAVTVALSGDGADELFAGYDRYRGEFLSSYYRALPRTLRRRIVEPAVGRLPAHRRSTAGEFGRLARKFVRGGTEGNSDRHVEWMRIPDARAAATVHDDSLQAGRTTLAAEHDAVEGWLPRDRQTDLGTMQAVDVRFTLPNQMLRKVDTASMYNSLEVRVPFLDTRVVESALGLPTSYKMTRTDRKRVLKRAFEDLLPSEILSRDKQGFDMPVGEWFRSELADDFRSAIRGLDTNLLDSDAVRAVYREHAAGRGAHGKFLWAVYVFARWFRRMRERNVLE